MRASFLALASLCFVVGCGNSDSGATSPAADGGTVGTPPGTDAGADGGSGNDGAGAFASCRAGSGAGIDTCGPGEPGTESCCASLPLPSTTTRSLDRYEITTGRLRAFVRAVAAANSGVRNIRAWAKDYAAAHPTSELGTVATTYPGLLDVLPDSNDPESLTPVQLHLGGTPIDAINTLDGCFMGPDSNGHTTYWQPPEDLKPFGIGYGSPADGVRKYPQSVLDAKPMNCVMPMMLATFCAWDGGELARTTDYNEIWGRNAVKLTKDTVYVPWKAIVRWGDFNWRNGHGGKCPIAGWPGCVDNPAAFYAFPTGGVPKEDDSPGIAAPGRFPKDITLATSANGQGWYDVGGNLMEAAWPVGAVDAGSKAVTDVCATSAGPGTGATLCGRNSGAEGTIDTTENRPGTKLYSGALPVVALVGYSFEVHQRRSEKYLSTTPSDESLIAGGDLKPITFQYGKLGGRCVRF